MTTPSCAGDCAATLHPPASVVVLAADCRTAPWPCRSAVLDRAEQSSVPAPAASEGHPRTRMPTARALLQDAQTRDPPVDAGLGQTSSVPENTLLSHGGMFDMPSAGGVLDRPNQCGGG